MARLTRARVVLQQGGPRVTLDASSRTVKRIAREELEARDTAARIIAEAKNVAATMVDEARAQAAGVAQEAAREAAAAEQAKLAALVLAFRAREERADEAALDRCVGMARVLAERLVGEAISVDPSTVAKLARQALLEARGARTARIEAHPDDVQALEEHLSLLGTAHMASVTADATIQRGCLRLRTDLGTIDAHLSAQLDRLARALRDALR